MEWLPPVIDLVGHIAWPATTLILFIVGLRRLPELARFIKTIRYKDIEITLRENFEAARPEAERLAIEYKGDESLTTPTEQATKFLEVGTSIAIIEVWLRLEREITKLIQHNGLMRFTTQLKFIEHLVKQNMLREGDLFLFRRLRNIRNSAVHASDENVISKAEVVEFSHFVDLLIAKLKDIKNKPGYINMPEGNPD